jgi:hypothetical protein
LTKSKTSVIPNFQLLFATELFAICVLYASEQMNKKDGKIIAITTFEQIPKVINLSFDRTRNFNGEYHSSSWVITPVQREN